MNTFATQLRGELKKMFARKRTYIGFGAFLVVELVIQFLLHLSKPQAWISKMIEQAGYEASTYLSGLTLGLLTILFTVLLLGALYLALVGGDVVSKEVEDGTMRMILSRPISRGRVLLLKVISCAIYTIALAAFVCISAFIAGTIGYGSGGLFAFSQFEKIFAIYDFWPGLMRYLLAIPFLSASLFSVTVVAFFLSCLQMKPAAATIITLSFFFIDSILKEIPFFESIRPFFITGRMATWIHVFEYRIPWEMMAENYAWLFAINGTLLVLAWHVFERRDFKS